MKSLTLILTIFGAALLLPAAGADACPMCKDTIASTDADAANSQYGSGPQASLPSGFNFSIYYMLAGLFCTIGLIAGVITKGVRDSNAAMSRRGFETKPKK